LRRHCPQRSCPNSPCVIFAMGQVQRFGQIMGYQLLSGGLMHSGNTQSSWDFRLQSQRNYLKPEISSATSAWVNVHK
jgi:hypothetical protein